MTSLFFKHRGDDATLHEPELIRQSGTCFELKCHGPGFVRELADFNRQAWEADGSKERSHLLKELGVISDRFHSEALVFLDSSRPENTAPLAAAMAALVRKTVSRP